MSVMIGQMGTESAKRAPGEGPPIRVLIVDNEPQHAQAVAESLERVGYVCTVATSGPEGVRRIEQDEFDLVLTDLVMNEVDGLAILAKTKETLPDAEVILITGHGTVPSAVAAMQQGAFNYLLKPLDLSQLRAVVEKTSASLRLRRQNADLNRRLDEKFGFEGVVGNSPQMHAVIDRLKRIAPTDATVLIQGATGTGKELVAQAIHQNSPRKGKPFVALNCAALSENILESELFGHIRGAFTDASTDRIGKFEYANGGTLFLDEVGDMPLATQIKLLRVLESNEITRVGSNDAIAVNVRIVSATNRNLEDQIAAGTFRSDLYHRLKVVTIDLPRLAERSQDIPLLIEHFIKQFAKRHHKQIKSMSTAARRTLLAFDWPGNVRQLRNVVESMVVVDYDGVLDLDDLPSELAGAAEPPPGSDAGDLASLVGKPLAELERLFIAETLSKTGGNRECAAEMLGIGQRTLYRKIKEFNL
jgi:two-component system, NtrC family, response regulator HydG